MPFRDLAKRNIVQSSYCLYPFRVVYQNYPSTNTQYLATEAITPTGAEQLTERTIIVEHGSCQD